MGRKKVEIRKIESKEARWVCFSRRRAGLFKKASDLSTLCGAQVSAVVFSLSGKAFSFSSSTPDAVLEGAAGAAGGDRSTNLAELHRCYGQLFTEQEGLKAQRKHMEERMAAWLTENSHVAAWVDVAYTMCEMPEEDLAAYRDALMKVHLFLKADTNEVLSDPLSLGGGKRQVDLPPAGGGSNISLLGGGDFEVGQSSGVSSNKGGI